MSKNIQRQRLHFKIGFLLQKKTLALIYALLCTGVAFGQEEVAADSLISFAKSHLNAPYAYGAAGPHQFDCSGFTSYVFESFGYKLNRSSGDQQQNGRKLQTGEPLQTGDLVFFKNRRMNGVGHVGIVSDIIENGTFFFIHAATKRGIVITHSENFYYKTRFVGSVRILTSPP